MDLDDPFIDVDGHDKQGASFGQSSIFGLSAAAANVTDPGGAPVIVATRLRDTDATGMVL